MERPEGTRTCGCSLFRVLITAETEKLSRRFEMLVGKNTVCAVKMLHIAWGEENIFTNIFRDVVAGRQDFQQATVSPGENIVKA